MSNIIPLHPTVKPSDVFDMMYVYQAITGVGSSNGQAYLKTVTNQNSQSSQGRVKIPARKGQLRGIPSNPVK